MDNDLKETFLSGLEQNEEKLWRICLVYAKNTEDAKDLFQEVLIRTWQSMPSFQFKSSIGTWMFRIAINVCLRFKSNHIKRQKRFVGLDRIVLNDSLHDLKDDIKKERLLHLRSCIKKLNETDKAIITLSLEELPYKEIAEITGLTENHIAVKVKRIKAKLMHCINTMI